MPGKTIPDPGFPDDTGEADPRLAAALAAYAEDRSAEREVLAALATTRLLVPVVAVLAEEEPAAPGEPRREKRAEMAVPTIVGRTGRTALPAFTSVDTLARWRADARPVPVESRRAALAAFAEGAEAVLLDPAGPVTYVVERPVLYALAEGRVPVPPAEDAEVAAALRTGVAAEPGVRAAYVSPAEDADLLVGLVLDPGLDPAGVRAVAEGVGRRLARETVLRARLGRGLRIAVLPPGRIPQGPPLYERG